MGEYRWTEAPVDQDSHGDRTARRTHQSLNRMGEYRSTEAPVDRDSHGDRTAQGAAHAVVPGGRDWSDATRRSDATFGAAARRA